MQGCPDWRMGDHPSEPSINYLEKSDEKMLGGLVGDDWTELPQPLVIDSGAAETVIPSDWCANYPTRTSTGQQQGRYYTAANGEPIYNEGEKTLLLSSPDGSDLRKMTFQCANVNKALGSVSQIVHNGNRVVFDDGGSYIQNKLNGNKLWLEERNGVYELPSYVAPCSLFERLSSDFARQGR